MGASSQSIPEGNVLTSVLSNLSLAFFRTLLFLHNMCDFFPPKNHAIKKFIVRMTTLFAPAIDCVLFVLLRLVFAALPSGIVWVDVPSRPFVVSGVANRSSYNVEYY